MSGGMSSATSYQVTIGGVTLKQPDQDGLLALVIEDHVDLVNLMTLRVGGAEGQPSWNFTVGDAVSAKMGSQEVQLFDGEITALEPSFQVEGLSTLTVRALDKTHRLGRGRKTRFWEDKKDSDVVSEVAAECGLGVDADATEETLPYILQRNESNIAFCKRLAARNNFQLRVEDGVVLFKKASFSGSAVEIGMGSSLRTARFSFNTADMVQKVVVRGWDIEAKDEIVGEATVGDVTAIGGGQLGPDVAGVFGDSTAYITDVPVSSQGMAKSIAVAEMERLARQFCHGSATLAGNDKVRAGSVIQFSGLSGSFNGKYYVVSSRHVISQSTGYTTEIKFISNSYGS